MTTFPATFRELVIPDLRRLCRVHGLFVALDNRTFSEAFSAVWQEASCRGALLLPDNLMLEIEEWVMLTILKHEAEFRPSIEEYRRMADRVIEDIERCEAQWGTM